MAQWLDAGLMATRSRDQILLIAIKLLPSERRITESGTNRIEAENNRRDAGTNQTKAGNNRTEAGTNRAEAGTNRSCSSFLLQKQGLKQQ